MSDALADLGLDLGGEVAGATVAEGSTTATEKKARAPRKEVNVGEIAISDGEELTPIQRNFVPGARESKYKHDELNAPVAKADGSGYTYSAFLVELQEGTEFDALARSVYSATNAENRKAKEAGLTTKYVNRTVAKDGKNIGIKVFRVDDTLAAE